MERSVWQTRCVIDHVADLLGFVGLDRSLAERTNITGPNEVLPSSFAVTEGATSLVAATSLAAAELSRTWTGTAAMPRVTVDTRHACAAFQSERHLELANTTELWDPLAGHYAASDGFVQFHTNFAHHRAGLVSALGLDVRAARSDVERECIAVGRFELEQRVSDAGGIAAALRTLAEWTGHPHAAFSGRAPVQLRSFEATSNDGQRRALATGLPGRPLAGLRVLDMTRVIAGPVCGRTLAAYGATVLRVGAETLPVFDTILADTTLGKRFCHIDLGTKNGPGRLFELIAQADVVVTGFRPGSLADRGISHEAMLEVNPHLVIAELSAFGTDGPWGSRRGFDSITQTATGIVDEETKAFSASKPLPLPCQFLDHGSGFLLSLGVLAALLRRHESGGSTLVEVSLLGTRNWLVSLGRRDHLAASGLDDTTIDRYTETRSTPYGSIRHVTHPGEIEGFDTTWHVGPAKSGADPAEWPTPL